jgi:hypothetical protein
VPRAANQTVRFTRVVERSGRPHVHTLWLPPEKDPEFKRARETHRLMTLEQIPGGGKADFGVVGYDAKHGAAGQFLIFPKSLKRFEDARVIGVKFDLIEQPKLASARTPKPRIASRAKSERRRAKLAVSESTKAPTSPQVQSAAPPRNVVTHEVAQAEEKTSPQSSQDTALKRQIRAALKELQRGNSVAAYQRLERALKG